MTDTYAGRIAAAVTGYELNRIAEDLSRAPIPADAKDLLAAAFCRRCRQLWPAQTYPRGGK